MHWEGGMEFPEIKQIFPSVAIEDIKAIIEYAEARGLSTVLGP